MFGYRSDLFTSLQLEWGEVTCFRKWGRARVGRIRASELSALPTCKNIESNARTQIASTYNQHEFKIHVNNLRMRYNSCIIAKLSPASMHNQWAMEAHASRHLQADDWLMCPSLSAIDMCVYSFDLFFVRVPEFDLNSNCSSRDEVAQWHQRVGSWDDRALVTVFQLTAATSLATVFEDHAGYVKILLLARKLLRSSEKVDHHHWAQYTTILRSRIKFESSFITQSQYQRSHYSTIKFPIGTPILSNQ
jgi:hypothetical protein